MIGPFTGSNRFLSNFYPCLINAQNGAWMRGFNSVEHAYQAMKACSPEDFDGLWHCATPADAKRKGKRIRIRNDWESVKVDIMRDLLRQKFRQPELKTQLLATGTEELVEKNWWGDTFWGVCNGIGENMLGKLLMEVREELRAA